MKRAIITGGTGFIGRHLVSVLYENSIDVIMLVREGSSTIVAPYDGIKVVRYDPQNLESLFEEEFPSDAVFYHLAWEGVDGGQKNAIDIQMNNIYSSVRMMEFAHRIGVNKFIAAGTVAEYVFSENAIDINEKQSPNDIYGACKVASHYILEVLARQLGIDFIWTVLPSTYGSERKGTNILSYTIDSLLAGEVPMYGDLRQMWDFLGVDEVARALYLIGEKGKAGKTYGIGSGEYKTLREYVEIIRDIINPDLELGIGKIPSYSLTAFSSCVNIEELTADTGFIPEVDFETGIKRMIDECRSRKV